jgi:hypothetical protein
MIRRRGGLARLWTALETRLLEQTDDFKSLADAECIVMPGAPQRTGFTVTGIVDAAMLRTVGRPVNADPALRGSRHAADELLLRNVAGYVRGRLRLRDGHRERREHRHAGRTSHECMVSSQSERRNGRRARLCVGRTLPDTHPPRPRTLPDKGATRHGAGGVANAYINLRAQGLSMNAPLPDTSRGARGSRVIRQGGPARSQRRRGR